MKPLFTLEHMRDELAMSVAVRAMAGHSSPVAAIVLERLERTIALRTGMVLDKRSVQG